MVSGVDDGARTHDRRDHNPELYQLSYVHHRPTEINQTTISTNLRHPVMARPAGLEPATLGLEGRCSIRLSYGRMRCSSIASSEWSGQRDSNPRPSAPKADALPDCAMPRHARLIVARPLPTSPSTADPHGSANHTDRPPQRQFRNVSIWRHVPANPAQSAIHPQITGAFPGRSRIPGEIRPLTRPQSPALVARPSAPRSSAGRS
jgi:hypothetical protein